MIIKQNPFTSKIFISEWLKHFNGNKPVVHFNWINNLTFYKKYNRFILYINAGKNLTKGVSYELNKDRIEQDFKNKVFLIYDIPKYFNVDTNFTSKDLGFFTVKQYPGFFIDLKKHGNIDDYLTATFSKSSVQKLKRYKKRLEQCFDIQYKVFYGEIVREEYYKVFSEFHRILTKRFDDKQITNNNLDKEEWEFYREVVYHMILEKKASLYVIYNKETPISVRLNYYSESIVFDAITTFDIDYAKFHLGKISILKILEWSMDKKYKIFDFSKGYFDYKESWGDAQYDFNYHIYYDKKSLPATLTANILSRYFKLKNFLREIKINEKLHRFSYFLRNNSTENIRINEVHEEEYSVEEKFLKEVHLTGELAFLQSNLYDFLYLSNLHIDDVHMYEITNSPESKRMYLIKGKNHKKIIVVNS